MDANARNHWEYLAVELLTEVSILGPLISVKVDQENPEGLNECRLSILMILARQAPIGIRRDAMVWMLEDTDPLIEQHIDALIAAGFVTQDKYTLAVTELGVCKRDDAIRALLPRFEPALQGISGEAMEQAMVTLREIRRTLDNLPD